MTTTAVDTFATHESDVRTYCRSFPAVFTKANGHVLTDDRGRTFVDFLMGAGSLNYGHNDPVIKDAVMRHLAEDGIVQSLDLHTTAKRDFIDQLVGSVLEPRGMTYKLQFTGPTGTNAVEAALKLARKVTGRTNVIAFTNGFHGMSLGALAATANPSARGGAGLPLTGVTTFPYDGYFHDNESTLHHIERLLAEGSGVDMPAAFIVESVQGEGGLNTATSEWLLGVERLAHAYGSLLIIDDIQAGCGRTGQFFSFESAGLSPDIVVLSKSLSGLGLPLSVVLIRPELDVWSPAEHTGTFRGNNLAFVAGAEAIRRYWSNTEFETDIGRRANLVRESLEGLCGLLPAGSARVKGRGLLIGLELDSDGLAAEVSRAAFQRGVIVETCGVRGHVLKVLPPLNIADEALRQGIGSIGDALTEVLDGPQAWSA